MNYNFNYCMNKNNNHTKVRRSLRKTEKTKRETALSASKRGSCLPARMNPLASRVRSGTGGVYYYSRVWPDLSFR